MSARFKSTLILLATLLLGMLIGALLNARFADQRIERLSSLRTSEGFVQYVDRSIDYEDEAQRAAVLDVLERSSARMSDHMQSSRQRTFALIDTTRQELAEVLNERQLEQLDQRLRQRRPAMDGPRGRGHQRRGRGMGRERPPQSAPPADTLGIQ